MGVAIIKWSHFENGCDFITSLHTHDYFDSIYSPANCLSNIHKMQLKCPFLKWIKFRSSNVANGTAKNCQKLGKRGKKSEKKTKNQEEKAKNWEGSFILPLMTERAGYAKSCLDHLNRSNYLRFWGKLVQYCAMTDGKKCQKRLQLQLILWTLNGHIPVQTFVRHPSPDPHCSQIQCYFWSDS